MLELCSNSRSTHGRKTTKSSKQCRLTHSGDKTLTQKITEKSFHMIFWEKSHLTLSPTSERTHDIVVLVQRAINCFQTVLEERFKQRAKQ